MTGVCASQMALTLLGGPNRLNPKNVHQRPTVALLCGPHVQGAQGISCGRHLANHDVQVILFLPNFVKMLESITNELSLFSKTQGQQVSSLKDLPTSPVDLVINCLDCPENAFLRDQPWYKAAVAWANQNRAPVLSIDPPVHEAEQGIDAKWSLALGLPATGGACRPCLLVRHWHPPTGLPGGGHQLPLALRLQVRHPPALCLKSCCQPMTDALRM